MFGTILKLILGSLGNIGGTIAGVLFKRKIMEVAETAVLAKFGKDITVAELETGAKMYQTRADMLKGFKITQWLIAAALIPPIIHQGAVFLDSTPFPYIGFNFLMPVLETHVVGSWAVPKAPPPYDDREWQMIAALLGIQGTMTVGLSFLKFLFTKR